MGTRDSIRIELTPEEQQQTTDGLSSELSSLELDSRELEQRVAPSAVGDVIKNIGQALQTGARAG